MYGWLWRHFPGGLPGKIVCSLAMTAVAVALLFLVVFPRVEPLLPFQDVTVDTAPTPTPTATATP
jgi:tellurite resistance protein TehA-like permease